MQAICHDTHNFMVCFSYDPAEAEINLLGTWLILAAIARQKGVTLEINWQLSSGAYHNQMPGKIQELTHG